MSQHPITAITRGLPAAKQAVPVRKGVFEFRSARLVMLLAMVALASVVSAREQPRVGIETFGRLPIAFEQNQGQADREVSYLARTAAFDVFFVDGATRIVKRNADGADVVDIRLVGGHSNVAPIGSEPLQQRTNYIRGVRASDTAVDIANFAKVRFESVYPGIDLVYYGTNGELEYDFVVAAHANPEQIRLAFEGVEDVRLSEQGRLVLGARTGDIEFRRPVAYQDIDGMRRIVAATYVLEPSRQVSFRLGKYDRNHPLVIDPVLSLSTNLWGNVAGVALDAAGNIYAVGSIWTSGLPASNGYQTQLAGSQDAYVLKLNPTGTSVIFATYLGARRVSTTALGIAVDRTGSAYVTGTTGNGYPLTPGAHLSNGSTFMTKLNPSGNGLAYSTYVASPVASLAVDEGGNVYMTGTATSLTTTPGAFQRTKTGASAPYVAKLASTGAAMVYATYLGGSANDEGKRVAVDAGGNAYVVGTARSFDFPLQGAFGGSLAGATDAFVAKLDSTGSRLVYSTLLGGSGNERGFGIAVDSAGQAHVTGWTNSTNFPVTPAAFQRTIGYPDPAVSNAFITKLNATGNALVYSSYLGGKWCLAPGVFQCLGFFSPDDGIDAGTAVVVDAAGYAYIGGYATSTLFPLVDSVEGVSPADADAWHAPLVAKVTPDGDRLVYATVVGTKAQDAGVSQIAVDDAGGVVAAGNAPGEYFRLTPGGILGPGNGFVFKLDHGSVPTTVTSSANPASVAQPLTLTATALTPTTGSVVTFKDGSAPLGTATVVSGRATLSVVLPPGVHRITATNSADNVTSPPYFQLVRGQ